MADASLCGLPEAIGPDGEDDLFLCNISCCENRPRLAGRPDGARARADVGLDSELCGPTPLAVSGERQRFFASAQLSFSLG